jgi:type IV secretion system protein VirB1
VPLHELGLALGTLITHCAPNVGPRTMAAIVSVESSGNPYAIDDDDTHTTYMPTSEPEAVLIIRRLVAEGHNFDAGIAQINSSNFLQEHLNLETVFDPCRNLAAGSDILTSAYGQAKKTLWIGHAPRSLFEAHAQEQLALYHAFSTYNSGDPQKSLAYADTVVAAANGAREISARYTPINAPVPQLVPKPVHRVAPTKPRILTFQTTLDPVTSQHSLPIGTINLTELAKNDGIKP